MSSSFQMPAKCASCLGAQQTTRTVKKTNRQGNWRTTRSFQIPYCGACAQRAQATQMKGYLFAAVALGIGLVFGGIGFLAPGIPAVVSIGLPVVLALGFAIAAMTALAPKPPAAPATAPGDAVKLVSFSGSTSTLYCVNPAFGDEFARANGIQALPKSRSMFFGAGALWSALIGAPLIAGSLWFVAHPQVHIDNAGSEALQIWLDGKKSIVVPPNPNGAVPPAIFVGKGKHTFGYSKEGGSAPEGTIDVDVTMNDAHLYNPERTACYWLIADSYGDATVMGMAQGPQPVKEFYTFDKVNTWFGDNPQSVEVSDGQKGDTRVALQRAKACMALAPHCDADMRDKFMACQKNAKDEATFNKCAETVGCAGPATAAHEASSAKPGAPTHVAPHGAPSHHPGAPPAPPAKTK